MILCDFPPPKEGPPFMSRQISRLFSDQDEVFTVDECSVTLNMLNE